MPKSRRMDGESGAPLCYCGSRRYEPVLEGTYDRLGSDGFRFKVIRCSGCGLARTLPVPDLSQYEKGYELTTEDGRFTGLYEDRWSEALAESIRGQAPGDRLLDIGCHVGNLVEAAAARGFRADGIDLDPIATARGAALGRRVYAAQIEDWQGEYDVVVLNHVLEHVLELDTFLGGVERVLSPGGRAFVFVPYYLGLMPRIMRTRWMGWFPSQHVWHFTPTTLKHVVETRSTLHLIRLETNGVIEPPSQAFKGLVKAWVSRVSRMTGSGDEIEAVFEKPVEEDSRGV